MVSPNPISIEIKSELTFLIFWIFLLFLISNFLARVGLEENSGVKFLSFFLGLSHPDLAKNNARNRFFNFLIFFLFFLEFSCPGRLWMEFGSKIFFPSFSPYFIPLWLKIMPQRGFSIFSIFFLFFLEFSRPGRVWTEFVTKIHFSLSRPILSRFG